MTELNWRWRFWLFIRDKVCETPPQCLAPKWTKIIYNILFPLSYLYERQSNIKYNPINGLFTIMGIEISMYDIIKIQKLKVK